MPIEHENLKALAATHSEVVTLWLYGSQAKGTASEHSDWDLAVAFDPVKLGFEYAFFNHLSKNALFSMYNELFFRIKYFSTTYCY